MRREVIDRTVEFLWSVSYLFLPPSYNCGIIPFGLDPHAVYKLPVNDEDEVTMAGQRNGN